MTAMAAGSIARIEELTRIPSDVQDALITILSEKTLPVPELGTEVQAAKGFNVIATANDRDRGVNELSSALRRRFNTVVLPLPATEEEEVDIVARRVERWAGRWTCRRCRRRWRRSAGWSRCSASCAPGSRPTAGPRLKSPTGTLSTAEAISVVTSGMALAAHFGDGVLRPADVAGRASSARSSRTRSPTAAVWTEYLEAVVRERPGLGATSTGPAARSAGDAEATRPAGSRCSASGTTGRARPASVLADAGPASARTSC